MNAIVRDCKYVLIQKLKTKELKSDIHRPEGHLVFRRKQDGRGDGQCRTLLRAGDAFLARHCCKPHDSVPTSKEAHVVLGKMPTPKTFGSTDAAATG